MASPTHAAPGLERRLSPREARSKGPHAPAAPLRAQADSGWFGDVSDPYVSLSVVGAEEAEEACMSGYLSDELDPDYTQVTASPPLLHPPAPLPQLNGTTDGPEPFPG